MKWWATTNAFVTDPDAVSKAVYSSHQMWDTWPECVNAAGESDRRDRKNSAVMATAEQDDRYRARPSQSAGEDPGSYLRRHDALSGPFGKVECGEEDEELLLSENDFCFCFWFWSRYWYRHSRQSKHGSSRS